MRRFVPTLIVVFIVGLLFRLGNQYGINILRMFATQGIVVAGIMAARALRSLQTAEGVRQVSEALAARSDDVVLVEADVNRRCPIWLVQTKGKKLLLGGSDLSQNASVQRAANTVLRQSQALWKEAIGRGWIDPREPVMPALVLLRRRLAEQGAQVDGVTEHAPLTLINPEGIGELLGHPTPTTG